MEDVLLCHFITVTDRCGEHNRLEDADDLGLFFQMGQILCHAPNLAEILVLV